MLQPRAIDGTYPNPADFHELKGDILFGLENIAAAKASYLLAIEKNGNLNKINSKLNRLN
jgi:predicted negative regulator of RcsB-dependent stress response